MSTLREVLAHADTLTFDCYGTLIDWRTGLIASLAKLLGDASSGGGEELYHTYVAEEARVEAEGYRSYRDVLTTAARRAARKFGVALSAARAKRLADMVPDWPPFPDTVKALARLKTRFRLGVLSNIDRDLFARTSDRLGVSFDFVVTAEDVKAYKPATGHFEMMLRRHSTRDRVIHVAQSVYHDGLPTTQLGLAFVWINRYKEANLTDVRPMAEYPDLLSFAEECG